jgi:hypothetical protein
VHPDYKVGTCLLIPINFNQWYNVASYFLFKSNVFSSNLFNIFVLDLLVFVLLDQALVKMIKRKDKDISHLAQNAKITYRLHYC